MTDIRDILDLERIDRDIFRGAPVNSQLPRTFGGQVAAQALVAAVRTVAEDEDSKKVHSLHGYFLKAGVSSEPTVFLVDRLRSGRSFSTRQVSAVQNGETIFSMQASFHREGDVGPEHADRMREMPAPDEIGDTAASFPASSRALLDEWIDWDVRVVPPEDYAHNPFSASQQVVWFKSKRPLPDEDTFHICALAYMSDMTLLQSSMVPHPGHKVQMASLDHAMWFLRPFRVDEWLLYDQVSPSASSARALTHGRIFDAQGNLVAMVTQEGLTRTFDEDRT